MEELPSTHPRRSVTADTPNAASRFPSAMSPASTRAEALFMDALALPATERAAFVERACAGDAALHARLNALIAAHDSATSLLEPPPAARALVPADEKPGEQIARYKLLEKLGEGGCGAVWAAEQREPVKRRVALKIIKLGMDTRQVIARFEAERQALAMMDHPNIAKMLDAGATATGRPFFVMELVRGIPITAYCDENSLTTAQRLELLIKVCHAIQHAHQKGIIHRDIKPSNVLVTLHDGEPVPKVIDFGIAKATQQELTEKTIYTKFQQFIGTPAYMSPEQAEMSGLDIDTRSDIYSLGVLLYELVTGRTPFDSKELLKQGVDEIRRTIRETEPPPPSARIQTMQGEELTTTARRRSADPRKLAASVRGDLDWVVMKCLEKDRTRRYETANGVAMDVQRFLGHEPVVARPPSTVYRVRKFIRRHRVPFSAAAAVLAVIVVGSILTTAQALRALRAERAENELRESTRQAELKAAAARRAAAEQEQRSAKIQWARQTALPEIERLMQAQDVPGAFALALQAEKFLVDDPFLTALWPKISQTISVSTSVTGAEIYAKPYGTPDAEWQFMGVSPLKNLRIARDFHRWQIKKEGYATIERATGTNTPNYTFTLLRADEVPQGMVHVPGANAAPRGMKAAQVESFFIDRYEVTNREFKTFVDRGGYTDLRYWRQPFVKDGIEHPAAEMIATFRDATGQFGPAGWRNGTYPVGQDDYPVTGVSWFEAAAFAESVGKRLPSIYQWARAAAGHPETITKASNFAGRGPAKVGAYRGMSALGVYDMAGNAKEWCWNEAEAGNRYVLGGAADEPAYMFLYHTEALSPFNRSLLHGFRCALAAPGAAVEPSLDGPFVVPRPEYAAQHPVGDEVFRTYRSLFAYDKTELAIRMEGDEVTGDTWRRQRVSFTTGYGGERMSALVFLPIGGRPPYQTVIFFPGSGALPSRSSERVIRPEFAEFIVKSGRAFVYPIYKSMHERGEGRTLQDLVGTKNRNSFRDLVVQWSKDLGRTIDYLETRSDIQSDKLSFVGFSLGGAMGFILPAVESRIKAIALISGGPLTTETLPEIAQINYAPRVTVPTLMVNGRFDFLFPEPGQRHLYEHLGTAPADKRHVLIDSGHIIRSELVEPEVYAWLNRYLGPVK